MGSLVVASHNIMHGAYLRDLVPAYTHLQEEHGLSVLCVQENDRVGVDSHARRITGELGLAYHFTCLAEGPGLATVFDTRVLRRVDEFLIPLPRLRALSWFERRYIAGGRVTQKYALVTVLGADGQPPFAVVNLHLDTAGTNPHRQRQIDAVVGSLTLRGHARRLIVCGDTNVYVLRRRNHRAALERVLGSLAALGVRPAHDDTPTHYFARQGEPMFMHRLSRLVGKLGLDHPLRYDVVCTDLPVQTSGIVTTPASDHDLVWARVRP